MTQLRGIVKGILQNTGSKSEGVYFYLFTDDNCCYPIHKESDNPFENESLQRFAGKNVQTVGDFRDGYFFAREILELK